MSGSGSRWGGDGLMSALMSPGVNALAGFAGSMAQAAMPSRMPVPFGAALGMAGQGALQGMGNALQMQQQAQQLKAAQLQNQFAQAAMPTRLAMLGGTTSGSGGSPFGAPAPGGGSGPSLTAGDGNASSGGTPPSSSGAGSPYLQDPNTTLAMLRYAMASGDDSSAAALINSLQAQAGGPGYAMGRDGTAFAVPGGGKDPGVISTDSAADANAKVPSSLVTKGWQIGPNGTLQPISGGPADPVYIGRSTPVDMRVGGLSYVPGLGWIKNPEKMTYVDPQGTEHVGYTSPPLPPDPANPTGSPGASGSGPSSPPPDPFPAWSQKIMGTENPSGNPSAPNATGPNGTPASSALGNGQFLDGTWPSVIRAVRPDLAAGKTDAQLLPLRSDPGLAASATEQYARQNAASLAKAGLPVTGGTVYLSHLLGFGGASTLLRANPSTPLSMLLPQAVLQANPVLQGKTAGDAVGWAETKMGGTSPASGGSGGSGSSGAASAQPSASPSAYQAAVGPNAGSFVPITDASGSPVTEKLSSPADEAVKDYTTKDSDAYEAAQNTQAWLKQISNAANTMNAAGGKYDTGPYAQERYNLMSNLNDAARTLGLKPPFDPNAVGVSEELRKATITAGFELSSHYEGHSRQAASTIQNATNAVPGMANSPAGLQMVIAGIEESAQANIDLHDYKTNTYKTQGAQGLVGSEDDYFKKFPPTLYAQRAISTAHPVKITDPSQFNNYLPGTYATLPNGKLIQVPPRPGAPPIPSYLQGSGGQG